MNREELKVLGLTDEQIAGVMENYGKSVVNLQKNADEKDAELKKYQKGGEYYTDPAEIERLKTFEKDTLTREIKAKKTEALTKLFKSANATDSVAKLLISGHDLEKIELDDKNGVKNGSELLKKAKETYADLFSVSGDVGVPQANPETGGGSPKNKPQIVF